MKNIFTGLILFCVLFTACKKDTKSNSNTPGDKLQKVSFTVNGFTQQKSGIVTNSLKTEATTSGPIFVNQIDSSSLYKRIIYAVYDNAGNFVHSVIQNAGDADFGTISDQLATGTYTVIFIGGEDYGSTINQVAYKYLSSYYIKSTVPLSQAEVLYTQNTGSSSVTANFNDTFYKRISLTVGSGSVSQSVSLNRVVGQLGVNILDAIPTNVKHIIITATPYSTALALSTGLPIAATSGYSTTISVTTALSGKSNIEMLDYMLNTQSPISVTITAYDILNNIIASKVISNVNIVANQPTILQGNLFGGTGTGSVINPKIDTSWIAAPTVFHF